jgi:hypothetical protein
VHDLAHRFRTDRRLRALEAAQHFVAIGIIGDEMGDLGALLEAVTRHGCRRHGRVQRFMEGVFAEVLHLVDGVGLADRYIEHTAGAGDFVDRELHRAGQRSDDRMHLVLLDQFERAGRSFAAVQLVIAHQ